MFHYKAWLYKNGVCYEFPYFETHEDYLVSNPLDFYDQCKELTFPPEDEDELEKWQDRCFDEVIENGWIRITTDTNRSVGILYHTHKLDRKFKEAIYDHAKEMHEKHPGVKFLLFVEKPRREYTALPFEDFVSVLYESRKLFPVILEAVNELDLEDRINEFCQSIRDRYPVTQFEMYLDRRDGFLCLANIVVNKLERKSGVGTKIMEEVIEFADKEKRWMWLEVAERNKGIGTTSSNRLYKFYRRFGFVRNKGRNKRYELSMYASMYRKPR